MTGRASAARQLDGDAGDHLGLRAGDEHAPIDEQVEVTEPPPAEHIGERLAGSVAFEHGVEVGDHPLGRRLVEHVVEPIGAAGDLAQPPRGRPLADPRRRLGEQLPPDHVVVVGELARPLVGGEGLDDVVEVAGQHVGQPVDREPDAVVGDPVLLEVVGADLLAPPAAADLRSPLGGALDVTLALGSFEQPRPQHLHRPLAVLQLAALVLHRHDDARRHMGDADGRVGRVDALPARPAGAEDVDLQVAVVDRDLDLVGLGQHEHGRRRGVDAALALGHRHPLDAVRPALVLEPWPGALALDRERHLVDPAEVAGVERQGVDAQPVAGGVGAVHVVQVAGEQVGLLATLGAADLDDDVAPGVRVGRDHQRAQLGVDVLERRRRRPQLGLERSPAPRCRRRRAVRAPPRRRPPARGGDGRRRRRGSSWR